jgi:hypothetical protein
MRKKFLCFWHKKLLANQREMAADALGALGKWFTNWRMRIWILPASLWS